ncbi:hypothetical protein SAMN06269250_5863 [Spirosoma fluviale]|uniref:Uncharacterized protein n=2 Tax=Spirosoma fluviale TaxID=1597977 RepID=A0A286GQ12_9BACT|nr:hypothetical protein SAMN06269250_5863 [Spirosoma fluviale]
MKETKEQQIGWLGMLMSIRPGTSQFADKFPLATLTLVNDWENYSIETDNEMREVSIDASDVESIEILKRVH